MCCAGLCFANDTLLTVDIRVITQAQAQQLRTEKAHEMPSALLYSSSLPLASADTPPVPVSASSAGFITTTISVVNGAELKSEQTDQVAGAIWPGAWEEAPQIIKGEFPSASHVLSRGRARAAQAQTQPRVVLSPRFGTDKALTLVDGGWYRLDVRWQAPGVCLRVYLCVFVSLYVCLYLHFMSLLRSVPLCLIFSFSLLSGNAPFNSADWVPVIHYWAANGEFGSEAFSLMDRYACVCKNVCVMRVNLCLILCVRVCVGLG